MPCAPLILVCGSPKSGKTTYANELVEQRKLRCFHCDDLIDQGLEWSAMSDRVEQLMRLGPYDIIEGVAVVRALRKVLKSGKKLPRNARIIMMGEPWIGLSKGQASMRKACDTIWTEISPELRKLHWVSIERG